MNNENIGKTLKEYREKKGLTQEQLANKLYVPRQNISRWELGKRQIDTQSLMKLCIALEVPLDEFLLKANGNRSFKDELEEISGKEIKPSESKIVETPKIKNSRKTNKKEKDKNPNIRIDKTDVYNIILSLYDDVNKTKKKIKKYFTIFLISILIILVCMTLFIITSLYNAVSIYNINGSNDSINVSNGIFVITRDKIYFDLGTITNNTDKEINDIELYYYDKKNNRSLVFKNEGYNKDKNIILHDFIGYNEYFNYDELDYILKSLTLELTLEDETIETVDLETVKENYSKILIKREQPAGNGENTEIEESEESKKLEKFVKEHFEANMDGYSYSIKYKGNVIDYTYLDKCLSIHIINNQEILESWFYDPSDNSLIHYKSKNELLTEDERINLKNNNKDNQEIIDEFYKYINLLKVEFAQ